jgi:hypothetical protein
MRSLSDNWEPGFSWRKFLGVACIALILFAGVLQVAHSHATGQVDHDCSLCVAAHHVVQGATTVALELSSHAVPRHIAENFNPLPRQRFLLKLANRPPPDSAFIG